MFVCKPTSVDSPEVTIERLREIKHWTPSKTEFMIRFVCKEYDFKKPDLLVWLAKKESSLGLDKRCGDGGKSCYLFQIQKPTWNDFTKWMGKNDLVYSNYVDQTIVTIWAIKNGYGNRWSPIRLLSK